jgi:hypothetical protein
MPLSNRVIALFSLLVFILVVVAIVGTEPVRMIAFALVLVLLLAYAIWYRRWWMVAAIVVGGLIGLM